MAPAAGAWEGESAAALDELLRDVNIIPNHQPAAELTPPGYVAPTWQDIAAYGYI